MGAIEDADDGEPATKKKRAGGTSAPALKSELDVEKHVTDFCGGELWLFDDFGGGA
jgi:hypothetical protein